MDYRIFEAINGLAGRFDLADDAFELISRFGPFVLIAILVGLWFWPSPRQTRDLHQWGCMVAVASATLALGLNQVLIRLWERPRPFISHHVTLLLNPSRDPSFPSDHATFAFAVASAIFLASRRAGVAALAVAALIAFSRVYVGAHYVGDVVAGGLIGSVTALAIFQLRPVAAPIVEPPLRLARRFRLA